MCSGVGVLSLATQWMTWRSFRTSSKPLRVLRGRGGIAVNLEADGGVPALGNVKVGPGHSEGENLAAHLQSSVDGGLGFIAELLGVDEEALGLACTTHVLAQRGRRSSVTT